MSDKIHYVYVANYRIYSNKRRHRLSARRPQPPIKRRSHVFPVVASASARPSAKLRIKQWIFYPQQINLIFTKKGVVLSLVMKVRVFETRKWPMNWVMYRTFTVFIGADGRSWVLCLKNLVLPLLKSVLNKTKSKSESDFSRQVLQHS